MQRRKSKFDGSSDVAVAFDGLKQTYVNALAAADLPTKRKLISELATQPLPNRPALPHALAAKAASLAGFNALVDMKLIAGPDFEKPMFEKTSDNNADLDAIWTIAVQNSWKGESEIEGLSRQLQGKRHATMDLAVPVTCRMCQSSHRSRCNHVRVQDRS